MVQLRLAKAGDASRIRDIYDPYVTASAVSFEEKAPTTDEVRHRIESKTEQYPWLVCVDETRDGDDGAGEIIGYAYASKHRGRAAYRWAVDVSVYVTTDARRGGVATGLYTALFEALRAQHYVNAYAGTALPNPASTGFHAAMGFEPIGTYEEVGYKHGEWHDVKWWVKRLGPRESNPAQPIPVVEIHDTAAWEAALSAGEERIST